MAKKPNSSNQTSVDEACVEELERLRLFAAVVESTDDAVLTKRLDGTITSWNAGAERLYGWLAEDVIGTSIERIVPSDRRAELWELLNTIRNGNAVRRHETLRQHRDGTIIPVELTISPVIAPDGSVEGASAIARDLRATMAMSAELRHRTQQLESTIAELQQFAYIASHDLQEPLRMMANFAELLNEQYATQLDEKGLRFLGHIQTSATRMQSMVRELLDYSQTGRSPIVVTSVDLRICVADAVDVFGSELAEIGATVSVGELPPVVGNANAITQIFQNLLSNAIKYRGPQPLHVSIDATDDVNMWRITVSDNGIGIDPRNRDRIFQMFQRLHGRGHSDGNGIGLAMVRRTAETFGGNVGFEANADGTPGTTFWFTVPKNPVDLATSTSAKTFDLSAAGGSVQ